MVKICPEHGLTDASFNYCSECGRKLWNITVDDFEKIWDFDDTDKGRRDYINYLKERHPELRFIPYTNV